MGSGSKGGTPTNATAENAQAGLADSLSSLMGQQEGQSSQLFNLAFPGIQQASQHESALASGSPNLIASAIAPAAQQVQQQAAGAKQNILNTAPSGGEKNLALENVDVAQGSQLGALASQGYNNAFNSLAQLGTSGVGQSQASAGTAIQAGGAAGNQWGSIVNENVAQKGATMGAIGSGVGDAAAIGMSFV